MHKLNTHIFMLLIFNTALLWRMVKGTILGLN